MSQEEWFLTAKCGQLYDPSVSGASQQKKLTGLQRTSTHDFTPIKMKSCRVKAINGDSWKKAKLNSVKLLRRTDTGKSAETRLVPLTSGRRRCHLRLRHQVLTAPRSTLRLTHRGSNEKRVTDPVKNVE